MKWCGAAWLDSRRIENSDGVPKQGKKKEKKKYKKMGPATHGG